MTSLYDILATRKLENELVTFQATEDWGQGRTCFGGFLSALAVVAMRDTMAIDAPLRSLQTNFVGPVPPGEVICKVRLLRQGKNVAQVQCEIWSQDQLCGLVLGVFGHARATQLPKLTPTKRAPQAAPESLSELPFIPNVTPQFLQHIHMRWAEGSYPYMGKGAWDSTIYIRTPEPNLSPEVQIVLLADGPPTPALSFFSGPTMASSVSWSLEFPPLPANAWGDGWFQIDLSVNAAAEGYTNLLASLWTPSGDLASFGHQVVAVYG